MYSSKHFYCALHKNCVLGYLQQLSEEKRKEKERKEKHNEYDAYFTDGETSLGKLSHRPTAHTRVNSKNKIQS